MKQQTWPAPLSEARLKYLGRFEKDEAAVARFVDHDDPSGLHNPEGILQALKDVKVCDLACGSGAYLLGMMHELLRLRTALFKSNAMLDAKDMSQRKLEIIENNLYGVDLDPFAVNIAMLRLWLSLIVEYDGDKRLRVATAHAVKAGQHLIRMQEEWERIDPGVRFKEWIVAKCISSYQRAYNYMRVAEAAKEDPSIKGLGYTEVLIKLGLVTRRPEANTRKRDAAPGAGASPVTRRIGQVEVTRRGGVFVLEVSDDWEDVLRGLLSHVRSLPAVLRDGGLLIKLRAQDVGQPERQDGGRRGSSPPDHLNSR